MRLSFLLSPVRTGKTVIQHDVHGRGLYVIGRGFVRVLTPQVTRRVSSAVTLVPSSCCIFNDS